MTAIPDYIVTTGDFIAEWMEDAEVNAAELARRLGVTPKHVSELLSGKAPLSHSLSLALERVSGVPAHIWNQYENGYRTDLARRQERGELERQYDHAKTFPLVYLRKWKIITATALQRAETVQQLLDFLGVANLQAFEQSWTKSSVAYRRAITARDDTAALATWLTLAEHEYARLPEVPPYDRKGLQAFIPRLRSMTAHTSAATLEEATLALRKVGVVVCFTPAIPGLGVYGATRWLHENPVIQLSLRGKSDDQLWFTLFHEFGHVLLHEHKHLYLYGEESSAEHEANDWAATTLIPSEFMDRLPTQRNISAITTLADELGIAPSLVLGQAQRRSGDYGWGHGLKQKLDFIER